MIENITVLAKAYPERSKKYGALVCTAGINEFGDFRRLYPVPWNQFFAGCPAKFSKWDIISVDITNEGKRDHRQESRKVVSPHLIKRVASLTTKNNWLERTNVIKTIEDISMCAMQRKQKASPFPLEKTMCLVKPRLIKRMLAKPRECITDAGEALCMNNLVQTDLYGNKMPDRLPWVGFKYLCSDHNCKGHRMMCVDWEFQELYRREGEEAAKKKLDWLTKRDLRFVCGTIWNHPFSWVIVSLLYPPIQMNRSLLD